MTDSAGRGGGILVLNRIIESYFFIRFAVMAEKVLENICCIASCISVGRFLFHFGKLNLLKCRCN